MKASFRINQSSIENVDNYEYLVFQLRFNGSFSRLITDRIKQPGCPIWFCSHCGGSKCMSALSLSLFDKQIVPILLYGTAVWSAPRTHNFIYLLNQMGSDTTRCLVQNVLNGISDSQIPFVYIRRVGNKPKQGTPDLRKILIKLQNYNHKEILLRTSAVKYELGRFPITHLAWEHVVKYWLRLESGTGHTILNEA